MAQCIIVGCDLHDANMVLRYSVDSAASRKATYRNNREGRTSMLRWLRMLSVAQGGAKVVFGYEASSQGFTLYDAVTGAGFECHVLAPSKMARSPQARRSKCDDKDAQAILDLLRGYVLAGNALPDVRVPDAQCRDDRELTRARLAMGDELTSTKTEVRCLLKRYGVEKPKGTGDSWSKGYRAWLESLVAVAGPLGTYGTVSLSVLLRRVAFCEAELRYLDEHIRALARTPRHAAAAQAVTARKGVGPLTAMVYLTELWDLRRFSNRRHIAGYLGLAPSKDESGEASDRKGHITHQGPARVRRVLAQAAWSWVRSDPEARAAFERLVARNPKKKKIALVAMMRRLGIWMWHTGKNAQEEAGVYAPAEAAPATP
jgi:transposase